MLLGMLRNRRVWAFLGGVVAAKVIKSDMVHKMAVKGMAETMKIQKSLKENMQNIKEEAEDLWDPEIDGCRNGQRHPGQNGHDCSGCGRPRLDSARRPRGRRHQQADAPLTLVGHVLVPERAAVAVEDGASQMQKHQMNLLKFYFYPFY